MVAPIDYTLNVKSPFESAIQGLQLGAGLADMQAKRDLQAAQLLKAEQEAQARAQQQAAMQEYSLMAQSVLSNPQATAQEFGRLLAMAPDKDRAKVVQDAWDKTDKTKQEAVLNTGGQVMAALRSQTPEVGIDLLRTRAAALRNSGDEQQAKAYEAIASDAEKDPIRAGNLVGYMLIGVPGGDKVVEGVTKMGTEQRAAELQPQMLAKAKEDARAKLAPAVQEAIDYKNLSPELKQTFQALQILKKPPAAVTNVNVSNIEKGASAELGKLVPDLYSQAQSAASQLKDIPRYRAAIDKAIVGPFAEQRLGAARIANVLGFSGDKGLAASNELIQGLAEMALKSRSMLTGQGQITEGEQKLLIKARSGDINFSAPELRNLLNVAERATRAQYTQSRKLLESASRTSETAGLFLENIQPVEEAPAAIPSGQPAAQPQLPPGFRVVRER